MSGEAARTERADPVITDLDAVRLCESLYFDPSFAWDDLLEPASDDGICVGIKKIDGVRAIVFRGSTTPQDWWRDGISEFFHQLAPPFDVLGDVAVGFSEGMPELYQKFAPLLKDPWVSVGHSLGSARATLFAGMGIAAGTPPLRRVGFGPPRVGCGGFCAVMAKLPDRPLYRNRVDPIADVPTDPPFRHDIALTELNAAPAPDDEWGILADHHIELYVTGLIQRA